MDSIKVLDLDVDLDLDFADLPTIDEMFEFIMSDTTPIVLSPAPKSSQTLYTEKISIRIPHCVLAAIKSKAMATGIGYQTMINLLLAENVNVTSPTA